MTTPLNWRRSAARTWTAAIGGIAAVAFTVAGCGGSSNNQHASAYGASGGTAAPAAASGSASASSAPRAASLALANSKLGKILVDSKGETLYLWQADKGTTSTCDGACASAWPPLLANGKPIAGSGLAASKLGTTRRSDGANEVTFNGHPLYTFAGDSSPGQTNGEGSNAFGTEWDVLSAAGHKVELGN